MAIAMRFGLLQVKLKYVVPLTSPRGAAAGGRRVNRVIVRRDLFVHATGEIAAR